MRLTFDKCIHAERMPNGNDADSERYILQSGQRDLYVSYEDYFFTLG